jgi:dynein heavy chain
MMSFLNCIQLIHFNCRNYSTTERISDLLHRVSCEIIRNCSNKIFAKEILYGNYVEVRTILYECIMCCNLWKKDYNRMAVNINSKKKCLGILESSEYWKINEPSIFAEVDAFAQRCDDLIDICNNRFQFLDLLHSNFLSQQSSPAKGRRIIGYDGLDGKHTNIENTIKLIQDSFRIQIEQLSKLDYCILNAPESKWHVDFSSFSFAVKVSSSFNKIKNCYNL